MADVTITGLPNASTLTGTERVPMDQAGVTVDASAQAIANLATAATVGLGSVNNTSDISKPISTATQAALDGKAAASHTQAASTITGLATVATTGAYTDLSGRPGLAAVATSGVYADLTGRPTLGTAAPLDVPATGDATATQVVQGNDSRLSDARTPAAHNQAASTITGLATVATSGSASDLGTGALPAARLPATAVSAGSYTYGSFTVDAAGRLTAASSGAAPVTSVTGSAPISSSGGATPAISISAATTDADGSMSATDKTKLNGIASGAQVNVATDLSYTASTRLLESSTGTDVTLPLVSSANAGLAPASGGGTANFLRADGTWATAGSPPGGSSGQLQWNSSSAFAGVTGSTVDSSGNITLGARLISSLAGAASAPPAAFTGTWFAGGTATTTKPQVLIEPSGATSTAWSTGGTGIGVNAASGFAGNLLDLQVNGTSRFVVNSTFIARQNPDSTTTGGNARGAGAVDLASTRGAPENVASGTDSFLAASTNGRASGVRSASFNNSVASGADSFAVLGAIASGAASFAAGASATASGTQSVALGAGSSASGQFSFAAFGVASGIYSFALNLGATASNRGQFAYGFRDYGAQWNVMGLVNQSTTSSPVELFIEGIAVSARAVLPANTTWAGTAMIAARTRNGISNATFQRQVMIKRDGSNNTELVGTVQTLGTDIKSNADFDATITITADNTNESLKVEGTAKVGGTVSSITSSGTTCTVTSSANHGLLTGEYVTITGANQTAYNGTFTITKTTDTAFTYTAASTPSASPATGTLAADITCRWVCKLDLVQITHSA